MLPAIAAMNSRTAAYELAVQTVDVAAVRGSTLTAFTGMSIEWADQEHEHGQFQRQHSLCRALNLATGIVKASSSSSRVLWPMISPVMARCPWDLQCRLLRTELRTIEKQLLQENGSLSKSRLPRLWTYSRWLSVQIVMPRWTGI